MKNIYISLTDEFNQKRLRAVICSGQAVVLHRLAIMSKDGDWIVREDDEACSHILQDLDRHEARYRFGAPLDIRWMAGGWSSHLEFRHDQLRVRTDFFTRPPRFSAGELSRLWKEQETQTLPFVNARELAMLKKTNREKDYVVIGELARLMTNPGDKLLYSRSARDLFKLASEYPELLESLTEKRPVLALALDDRDKLAAALDAERRNLIKINEDRLKTYLHAAEEWEAIWPDILRRVSGMRLIEAHQVIVNKALGVLPMKIEVDR